MKFLSPDFVEFIECCDRREVRFLIVGGYAVAAHGHPRATKDLDVWVLGDPGNAERLVRALDDFGMGSVGLTPADFMEPDVVVQLPRIWSTPTSSRSEAGAEDRVIASFVGRPGIEPGTERL